MRTNKVLQIKLKGFLREAVSIHNIIDCEIDNTQVEFIRFSYTRFSHGKFKQVDAMIARTAIEYYSLQDLDTQKQEVTHLLK